MANIGKLRLLN